MLGPLGRHGGRLRARQHSARDVYLGRRSGRSHAGQAAADERGWDRLSAWRKTTAGDHCLAVRLRGALVEERRAEARHDGGPERDFIDENAAFLVQKGIYDLQGDVFVVNFAKPGDDRPRDFQTRPGSEEATVRYIREKK